MNYWQEAYEAEHTRALLAEKSLDAANAELRKQWPAVRAVFDREVWARADAKGPRPEAVHEAEHNLHTAFDRIWGDLHTKGETKTLAFGWFVHGWHAKDGLSLADSGDSAVKGMNEPVGWLCEWVNEGDEPVWKTEFAWEFTMTKPAPADGYDRVTPLYAALLSTPPQT